jgi:hypothetical protein
MEEALENGKESLHSAHANGMNEWMNGLNVILFLYKTLGEGKEVPYLIKHDTMKGHRDTDI